MQGFRILNPNSNNVLSCRVGCSLFVLGIFGREELEHVGDSWAAERCLERNQGLYEISFQEVVELDLLLVRSREANVPSFSRSNKRLVDAGGVGCIDKGCCSQAGPRTDNKLMSLFHRIHTVDLDNVVLSQSHQPICVGLKIINEDKSVYLELHS